MLQQSSLHFADSICMLRRMLLSRQFHPRIGALAAANMNRRHVDPHNPLQEPLLLNQNPPVTPVAPVSAAAGQRLLSAMDMLKPILAESPEKEAERSLHHGPARGQPAAAKAIASRRPSENGTLSHIV